MESFLSTADLFRASPLLFSLRRLSWTSSTVGDHKAALPVTEVESFQLEIADAEEREAHLKAKLDHVDGILRSARLADYLYVRTRWTELPGEPPIIDDTEVDDWLPQFVVFSDSCILYYQKSTDLSPQDSILLSDVVEVGLLPSFERGDQEILHGFFILTSRGSKSECVDSWLTTLQLMGCHVGSTSDPDELTE
ncbi:unnamed protein product [Spirodela intermedia]|uniref:Uncharacterized protein n=1 Tax=Spirodela intermedia TaxID=51605 RepID=A0A7I8JMX0_SPIIN|nr:unnamed protein product [Spirodela intermedia]CAA6671504.1 unnamed protein product [Spirodela intermedia]